MAATLKILPIKRQAAVFAFGPNGDAVNMTSRTTREDRSRTEAHDPYFHYIRDNIRSSRT